MGKVYSYLRFSAAKQSLGASTSRQLDYARKWAADYGMVLDETLSMRDEGLSAYHQRHIRQGALGIFMAAVNEGRIPPGSTLIVEGLDRLSRAEPMVAQPQLAQIINAGITVVTVADGKTYSRESLKANPMDLLYSLLVIIRAHEESETKSKRVADVLRRRCEAWIAGTYRGKISCGADPSWVKWTGKSFELDPEISEGIRLIARLFIEGYGALRIIKMLDERGIKSTGCRRPSNINQLLGSNTNLLIGTRVVNASGTLYTLENYYPPLLTADEHARLVIALDRRRRDAYASPGKTRVPSIITGTGIGVCGHCGAPLVTRNHQRKSAKGVVEPYRRLACCQCETGGKKGSCNSPAVENAILDYCSDQINLESLMTSSDRGAPLRAELAALASDIAEAEAKIGKLIDAGLAGDSPLPQAMIKRLHDMELQLGKDKEREKQIIAELAIMSTDKTFASSAQWQEIRDGVVSLDYDARVTCRRLVAETFRKIQIFMRGARPGADRYIDILLLSIAGNARWLRIERATGAMVQGRDMAPS